MGNERKQNPAEVVVRNEAGDLEIINLDTGEVVANNHGEMTPMHAYRFSYEKALYICQLVKEGKTMGQICDIIDTPLHIISHWQRTDRMFAEELKIARRERAEFYHDQAMLIAKTAAEGRIAKDDVPAMTLAVKTYQWGAEKAKPESYGNKVTHEGSAEKPILMRVINTGISRSTKPDVIVAQTKEVVHVREETNREGSTRDHGEDEEGKASSPE